MQQRKPNYYVIENEYPKLGFEGLSRSIHTGRQTIYSPLKVKDSWQRFVSKVRI